MNTVERWGMFEQSLPGRTDGNPFTDHEIRGTFRGPGEEKEVYGFYDGDGRYVIRFMPSFEGEYHYRIYGSFSEEVTEGSFFVAPPAKSNHGPVHVANTYHFAYADGTPYYSIGTTCYVWALQSDERIRETLESLKESAFNKIRFCIFPKHYDYNLREPRSYPYEGTPMDSSVLTPDNFMQYSGACEGNHWDFYRFNPAHFRHLEWCVLALQKLGIEADLIVMHPYDRWGFSEMTADQDDLYWKYVLARFSAFRNVWWAFANEYDLMKAKTEADWERFATLVEARDPYAHPRSIHNCIAFYDHSRPWITHCSLQRQDLYRTAEFTDEWRETYKKPAVLDEIAYEGNIQHGWGNITGEELVRRFWETVVRGGYPGHGETMLTPDSGDVLWWSHGGKLRGESHKRFRFLHDIMCETPGLGLRAYEKRSWDEAAAVPEDSPADGSLKDYYLFYYSFMRPSFRDFYFDDETDYEVRVLDTWNMTIEERGVFRGHFRVPLPGRQYMAVQIRIIPPYTSGSDR